MTSTATQHLTTRTVHQALQQLLDDYLSEKAESQADNDTRFTEYWECACRTIYEVAELLNIPLEDPWVDPSWERTVEYETMLQTTRTGKRQRRKRQKAGRSYAE